MKAEEPPPPGGRSPFDVQGHRGARGLLPENTLEAFRAALELGVSTLEMDLGVTADGVVVVSHDPFINGALCRPPDGSRIRGRGPLLKDLTLAQVQAYDCGALNPNPRRFREPPRRNIPGARIPTLAQVFALARDLGDNEVQFNIETKIHPELPTTVPMQDFVDAVLAVVRQAGLEERVILQSFDWRSLRRSKRLEPRVRTAALLSPATLRGAGGTPSAWLGGLDFDACGGTALGLLAAVHREGGFVDIFSPDWALIRPGSRHYLGDTTAAIRAAGYPVLPWTLNAPRELERALDEGVSGIITDYPDRLLDILRRRGWPVL